MDISEKKEKYEGFTPFHFIRNLINRLFGITDQGLDNPGLTTNNVSEGAVEAD